MNRKIWRSIAAVLIVAFTLSGAYAQEQRPAKKEKASTLAPLAASSVIGSGTPGQITKWTGVSGSTTYTIGDSIITEDKFGKVGIGTRTPTSPLTVAGLIETTLGGYKFPDGTVQTTAGIASVVHDASLKGDGSSATPLGIALGGVQTIHLANGAVTTPKIADGAVVASKIANGTVVRNLNGLFDNVSLVAGANITVSSAGNMITVAAPNALTMVAHDATLTGNGTTASPLSAVQEAGEASQPFQVHLDGPETFTVPAGKRLVIEYVAAYYVVPTTPNQQPNHWIAINTKIGSATVDHFVLTYRTYVNATETVYNAGQIVRLYADPGTQVSATFPDLAAGATLRLSGHFVNVP